jgi:hypothetical protein
MDPLSVPNYVISLEEISWGGTLVAITTAIHGVGMMGVLRTQEALENRLRGKPTFAKGLLVVLASWMILLIHLLEILVWAGFLYWKGAVDSPNANASLCYYFSLNEYTTLGSDYKLILRWRLLEGMISVAGLLTFAWSTGVLFTLARSFQEQGLSTLRRSHGKVRSTPVSPSNPPYPVSAQ